MQQLGSLYLASRTPDPSILRVKIQLFQNMAMLHTQIKGNGAKNTI